MSMNDERMERIRKGKKEGMDEIGEKVGVSEKGRYEMTVNLIKELGLVRRP